VIFILCTQFFSDLTILLGHLASLACTREAGHPEGTGADVKCGSPHQRTHVCDTPSTVRGSSQGSQHHRQRPLSERNHPERSILLELPLHWASWMFNRITPHHRDSKGFLSGFDYLLTLGGNNAVLKAEDLGIEVKYQGGCVLQLQDVPCSMKYRGGGQTIVFVLHTGFAAVCFRSTALKRLHGPL
jgi:hypothetical protein